MKKIIPLFLLLFLMSTMAFSQAKLIQKVEKKANEIVIPFQKYVLPNGLTVIVHEDHSGNRDVHRTNITARVIGDRVVETVRTFVASRRIISKRAIGRDGDVSTALGRDGVEGAVHREIHPVHDDVRRRERVTTVGVGDLADHGALAASEGQTRARGSTQRRARGCGEVHAHCLAVGEDDLACRQADGQRIEVRRGEGKGVASRDERVEAEATLVVRDRAPEITRLGCDAREEDHRADGRPGVNAVGDDALDGR